MLGTSSSASSSYSMLSTTAATKHISITNCHFLLTFSIERHSAGILTVLIEISLSRDRVICICYKIIENAINEFFFGIINKKGIYVCNMNIIYKYEYNISCF